MAGCACRTGYARAAACRRGGRVVGALLLVQSAAIAWLVQAVLVQHLALAQLRNVGAGLLVALIGRALLNAWAQALVGTVADVARRELRARIARRLVQHGPLWLRRQRSGELGELSLAHTDALEGYFVGYQFARTEMLLVPPLILIAVFSVDWVVGLVLLLTAPLIPFFMMLVGGAPRPQAANNSASWRAWGTLCRSPQGPGIAARLWPRRG